MLWIIIVKSIAISLQITLPAIHNVCPGPKQIININGVFGKHIERHLS